MTTCFAFGCTAEATSKSDTRFACDRHATGRMFVRFVERTGIDGITCTKDGVHFGPRTLPGHGTTVVVEGGVLIDGTFVSARFGLVA